MNYLHLENLNRISPESFQATKPYPWVNPHGLLTETGYDALEDSLPKLTLFTKVFGKPRSFGQASHNRYALEYSPELSLPRPWKDFITELSGKNYRMFLQNLLDVDSVDLHFHWHYTPHGCSVSPHCDAKHKLGSHIFYFNRNEDWDPAWGGETLILDDGGRFDRGSAPDFEDFDHTISAKSLENYSLLFGRRNNSWHGVRPINCPENKLRKAFIVVINRNTLVDRIKRRFRRSSATY